jgi:hypothetical protein
LIPSTSPYSSITIAMCWFDRRNSVSSAAMSFVSGTIVAGRRSSSRFTRIPSGSCMALIRSRMWRIPTMSSSESR